MTTAVYQPQRSAVLWLWEREVLRFLNIWRYSLVGPVLSTLLFVVVFGSALGHHVDHVDGISYGHFILPGLVAQTMLNVGFFNGTTSLFEAAGIATSMTSSPARCVGGRSTWPWWGAVSCEQRWWAR